MKKFFMAFLLLGSVIYCSAQSQSTFRADRDTVAENEIKKLEYRLIDLLASRDIDTYSGYLTDDYIRVAANGVVSTKEQALDGFRNPKMPGSTGKQTPHDLNVRVYGNTAILRAILDIETKTGDVINKRTSIITKVFIKRNGKWYMASMQGTAIP